MTETTHKTPATIAAHILSDLFSPLLAPTYAMIAAMWLTRLHYLPLGTRIWATAGITVICALIPLVVIGILMRRGKVSDMSISNRRQRTMLYSCRGISLYSERPVLAYNIFRGSGTGILAFAHHHQMVENQRPYRWCRRSCGLYILARIKRVY